MRNGSYNNKLDVLFLLFNEHDKDIKYTQNIFHVVFMFRSRAQKKRILSSYQEFLFHKFSPLGPEKR